MEQEKQVFNLAQGVGEVTIRQGQAPKVLDQKEPLGYSPCGQIGAVQEFLAKRINAGQFEQKDCTIYVNREYVSIELVFNERDPYNYGKVAGALSFNHDYEELRVNRGYIWTPDELGMMLKMHRYWFENKTEGMKIISTLLNYKADISQKVEKLTAENGNRTDYFSQVVNSNLPPAITLKLPIFNGVAAQPVEVEFIAKVDGRNVGFILISPGAKEALAAFRDEVIDRELEAIRAIAPAIAIIEQ